MAIEDPFLTTDEVPSIKTDVPNAVLDETGNDMFEIVHSDHSDSPPVGQQISICEVNLVRGKVSEQIRTKATVTRRQDNMKILSTIPGGEYCSTGAVRY